MLQGYVDALLEMGHPIHYLTSAFDDPIFSGYDERLCPLYLNNLLPSILPKIDSQVLVTTMPDLGKLHVRRPPSSCDLVYVFHSLNSIHEVYREGAFDNYDHFFCTGPHHKQELSAQFKLIGKPCPELHEVGYYKLDRIKTAFDQYQKKSEQATILVAPSWGDGNLLESHGIEIVKTLLALDLNVVVRPHPCFFLPIYPNGSLCIAELKAKFSQCPNFTLERSIASEDSFFEADLMISDFSGAAFEYAFGTSRPVLFVDVARKTKNKNWKLLGLDTFEDKMRFQLGTVIDPSSVKSIGDQAKSLINNQNKHAQRIAEIRSKSIYNFGNASQSGAAVIDQILNNK